MALRIAQFGANSGFSDQPVSGTHYYSQGFTSSHLGAATMYSIVNRISSATVSGMGNIKYFATGPGGSIYAQDDAGQILKEATPGQYDFSIVRSPGGNGAGLLGDQYGNLYYACGTTNNQLGKYDGASWNDTFQSLSSTQHPGDTYEDLVMWANGSTVACLFSDGSWNSSAFTLPSQMTIAAYKSGPTGILMGANFGYQGALILWDGSAPRAKTPWKWTKGQILAIEKAGENWLVKTQREVLLTNGYTIKTLFGVFDDPLSFKSYDNSNILPQQMVVINDTLIFAVTSHSSIQSYELGKMKPGIYLYSLSRHAWNYFPVGTGNTSNVSINSLFADVNFNNRIFVGYRDNMLAKNYIATLTSTPPTKAQLISEVIGSGGNKGIGPTEKSAEAVVLNLSSLDSQTDPATLTFSVALKLYNFKRQLWGSQVTNTSLSDHSKVQVDGSSSSWTRAQVGDEVTILSGLNAGAIAHIASIANPGTSTETWTLNTTLASQTESGAFLQVMPFVFVKKQTFTGLTALKDVFFNISGVRGKQFLAKFVFDGIGSNLAIDFQPSYFVFDDLGYDQT